MNGQRPPHDDDWSVPETVVMDNLRAALAEGRPGVVATISAVEGSAYRRPGAKMLVDDEQGVGSITAGCLEDEVVSLAEEVLASGEPRLERFDLTDDEEWGLGLGCNGVIDLLLEPLDDRFARLAQRYADGEDGLALAVTDPGDTDLSVGDRADAPDGDLSTVDCLPAWLVDGLADRAADLYDRGKSVTLTVDGPDGEVRVFVDPVLAPPELYVFGSGNDAKPVSELAAKADFRVTVVAFRGGRADAEAFPGADRVVSASAPRVAEELEFDADTYAVVMSHNFVDDRMAVESLLETPTPYIGLMGPDSRFERLRDDLADAGRPLTDADLDRLYAPIGLDLGGGAPYQIATSIVSEVLAVHNGRQPRHLRERKSPIHGRLEAE
jgi:xanthine dehydrogenase accessory factor